jgi:hypothetical protein
MDNYAAAGRLVPKDERMPASKDYAPVSDPAAESPSELPRSRSPDFYRMLFAKEGSGTRDGRSGNSPWWWAAEILSLLLGCMCWTGASVCSPYNDILVRRADQGLRCRPFLGRNSRMCVAAVIIIVLVRVDGKPPPS